MTGSGWSPIHSRSCYSRLGNCSNSSLSRWGCQRCSTGCCRGRSWCSCSGWRGHRCSWICGSSTDGSPGGGGSCSRWFSCSGSFRCRCSSGSRTKSSRANHLGAGYMRWLSVLFISRSMGNYLFDKRRSRSPGCLSSWHSRGHCWLSRYLRF